MILILILNLFGNDFTQHLLIDGEICGVFFTL